MTHKTKLYLSAFIFSMLFANYANADNNNNEDYFKAMDEIMRIPQGASEITSCPQTALTSFINKLKQPQNKTILKNTFNDTLVINDKYELTSRWGDIGLDVLCGDFNNTNHTQYAIITTEGTMRSNTIYILEDQKDNLVPVELDKAISTDLLKGEDLSKFYMHVARPFAYTMNGKTYIRFATFPYQRYDAADLRVCTYLFDGEHIKPTGPNWRIDKKTNKRAPALDCVQ